MKQIEQEIHDIIDKETNAWNKKDVKTLIDIFHPDMVWAWPPKAINHDPVTWELFLGRYSQERWGKCWQDLFNTHELIHNKRETIKVNISKEEDGAFAVVDIDTLWKNKVTNDNFHWFGRTCKIYVKKSDGWKMINQIGALKY